LTVYWQIDEANQKTLKKSMFVITFNLLLNLSYSYQILSLSYYSDPNYFRQIKLLFKHADKSGDLDLKELVK
jgi:hypothetical protein